MILGVCLVVNELHKGQRLVFRYPECIPHCVSHSRHRGLAKLYTQFFSLSQDNFARLFRPKKALNHKVLEIAIDDLIFISHPCQCPPRYSHNTTEINSDVKSKKQQVATETTTAATAASITPASNGDNATPKRSATTSSGATTAVDDELEDVITMFNIVIVGVSCRAMVRIDPDFAYRCQTNIPSVPGADPVAAAMGQRAASHGVCKPTLRRVVEAICLALYQHEKKSRYVSSQVALMLRIRERVHHPKLHQKTNSKTTRSSNNNSGSSSSNDVNSASKIAVESTGSSSSSGIASTVVASGATVDVQQQQQQLPECRVGVVVFTRSDRSWTNSSGSSNGSCGSRPPLPTCAATTATSDTLNDALDTSSNNNSSSSGGVGNRILSPASSYSNLQRAAAAPFTLLTPDKIAFDCPGSIATVAATAAGEGLLSTGDNENNSSSNNSNSSVTATAVGTSSSSNSSSSGGFDESEQQQRQGGWNLHVLREVLLHCTLANELRILYHNLVGGHSVTVAFNCLKTANIPLTCKDRSGCDDAQHLRCLLSHRSSTGTVNIINSSSASSSSVSSGSISRLMYSQGLEHHYSIVGVNNTAAHLDGNRQLQGNDNYPPQLQQQLELPHSLQSRLYQQALFSNNYSNNIGSSNNSTIIQHSPARYSSRFSADHAKIYKGVNLSTQTMLTIADTNTVLRVLAFLDGRSISAVGNINGHQTLPNTAATAAITDSNASNNASNSNNSNNNNSLAAATAVVGGRGRTQSSRRSGSSSSKHASSNSGSSGVTTVEDGSNSSKYTRSSSFAGYSAQRSDENSSSSSSIWQNSRLYNFIEAADPTQCFLELSIALDEPVEELISMANYLQSWGLAEIVPLIYSQSRYKVHAAAPTGRETLVGRAFDALLLTFNVSQQLPPPLSSAAAVVAAVTPALQQQQDFNAVATHTSTTAAVATGGPPSTLAATGNEGISSNKLQPATTAVAGEMFDSRAAHPLQNSLSPARSSRTNTATTSSTAASDAAMQQSRLSRRMLSSADRYSTAYLLSPSVGKRRVSPYREDVVAAPTIRAVRSSEDLTATVSSSNSSSNSNSSGSSSNNPSLQSLQKQQLLLQEEDVGGKNNHHLPIDSRGTVCLTTVANPPSVSSEQPSAVSAAAATRPSATISTAAMQTTPSKAAAVTTGGSGGGGGISSFFSMFGMKAATPVTVKSTSDRSTTNIAVANTVNNNYNNSSNSNNSSSNNSNSTCGFDRAHIGNSSQQALATIQEAPEEHEQKSATAIIAATSNAAAAGLSEKQSLLNLDCVENVPLSFSLPAVLSCFDGERTVEEIIALLPQNLRDFAVDIVVFLLRWHMLARVDSYVVNLQRIFDCHQQQEIGASFTATSELFIPGPFPRINFDSATATTAPIDQQRQSRLLSSNNSINSNNNSSNSNNNTSSCFHSAADLRVWERLLPHVQHCAVSSRSTAEIAWLTRVSEKDLLRVLLLTPHLRVVKKLSC